MVRVSAFHAWVLRLPMPCQLPVHVQLPAAPWRAYGWTELTAALAGMNTWNVTVVPFGTDGLETRAVAVPAPPRASFTASERRPAYSLLLVPATEATAEVPLSPTQPCAP